MKTLQWKDGQLLLLDQTKLPLEETIWACTTWEDVAKAISVLAVRGAPAIGVAAAYAVVLAARTEGQGTTVSQLVERLGDISRHLDATRPTAVNLHWALTRMMQVAEMVANLPLEAFLDRLEQEAIAIEEEDISMDLAMAAHGATELEKLGKPLTILTHCNAGALATAGIGTALGVIRALHDKGLVKMVYADETRPLLQGARLTAYELQNAGIPVTVITDNMAAWVMKTKGIDVAITGADRIVANGDTANKIGTYSVAILAREHHVPFYVAAPLSTFDMSKAAGEEIPIEERDHDEVQSFRESRTCRSETLVFNPAFDVTPHEYIAGIFTEKGTILHPDTKAISAFLDNL